MAFETTATVFSTPIGYRLHPDAKRYTLCDDGFIETNGDSYQLIRPLNVIPRSKEGFELKITASEDTQTSKASIITANELRVVGAFKDLKQKTSRDKFYSLMDRMISRGSFEKIEQPMGIKRQLVLKWPNR